MTISHSIFTYNITVTHSGAANDRLGQSGLVLSNDTLIAGTGNNLDYGSAWVWREFIPGSGTWNEIFELTRPASSQFNDNFGWSCAIVDDVDDRLYYLIGGFEWDDIPSEIYNIGAVFTYRFICYHHINHHHHMNHHHMNHHHMPLSC